MAALIESLVGLIEILALGGIGGDLWGSFFVFLFSVVDLGCVITGKTDTREEALG